MVCRAADLLFEDFGRARFVQGAFLRGQRLADGADARVTIERPLVLPIDPSFAHTLRTQ